MYTLAELLEGKYYYSKSRGFGGIIKRAELREDVLTAQGEIAFSVRVRNQETLEDFWATVYVNTETY